MAKKRPVVKTTLEETIELLQELKKRENQLNSLEKKIEIYDNWVNQFKLNPISNRDNLHVIIEKRGGLIAQKRVIRIEIILEE